ncbi:unnamed protein product, partial [Nesidiocoris tenuis]
SSRSTLLTRKTQLDVGDRVQAHYYSNNKQQWRTGVIIGKLGQFHFTVKLDDGYTFKRHIDQLRRSHVLLKQVSFRRLKHFINHRKNQKNRSFRTSCVFVLMLRLHQPHKRRLKKKESRLDLRHRVFLYADQAGLVVHHDTLTTTLLDKEAWEEYSDYSETAGGATHLETILSNGK